MMVHRVARPLSQSGLFHWRAHLGLGQHGLVVTAVTGSPLISSCAATLSVMSTFTQPLVDQGSSGTVRFSRKRAHITER